MSGDPHDDLHPLPRLGKRVSVAYLCEICLTTPRWEITRMGDVVVTWSCAVSERVDAIPVSW